MPATATNTSSLPNSASTVAIIATTCSSSVTSHSITIDLPPSSATAAAVFSASAWG
jgi:hypothetical protein